MFVMKKLQVEPMKRITEIKYLAIIWTKLSFFHYLIEIHQTWILVSRVGISRCCKCPVAWRKLTVECTPRKYVPISKDAFARFSGSSSLQKWSILIHCYTWEDENSPFIFIQIPSDINNFKRSWTVGTTYFRAIASLVRLRSLVFLNGWQDPHT